jgi:hypothetical protein
MEKRIIELRKTRWLLRLMGWLKIPMLAYVKPRLIAISDAESRVQVRLR